MADNSSSTGLEARKQGVLEARRIVLKLGTKVLTHADGKLALGRLFAVIEMISKLRREGREVLIVSSGAVGLGARALDLSERPRDLAWLQASAAVGQSRLMAFWDDALSRVGLLSAQVLLTETDFEDRGRYLNLRRTLETLIGRGVVPIINENDVVATEELESVESWRTKPVFGDNDRLSALVAAKLDARLLILLTDVEGVFDRDPRDREACLLESLDLAGDSGLFDSVEAGPSLSGVGKGGMRSKLEAAMIAAKGGCHVVVASGLDQGALGEVLAGNGVGTWIPAHQHLCARSRWIAFAAAAKGALVLDDGAVEALRSARASLLAAGICKVEGDFDSGDVIDLFDRRRSPVGRGMIRWNANTVRRWCAGDPPTGVRNAHCLIRRNYLVLEDAL